MAFISYTYALRNLPITIVALYSYVNPLVAVLLGWIVLGEKLNATIWMGMAITLLGIYLVNTGYSISHVKKFFVSKRL